MKKTQNLIRSLLLILSVIGALIIVPGYAGADSTYGSGNYGACVYSSCSITMTTSTSVSLSITPTPSGACKLNSDTVNIQTENSNGYALTMQSSSASNSLTNGTDKITATSGTVASPTTLANNKWGFRVDGQGGFGSGPTTTSSNAGTISFAGVPTNIGSPASLVTTSSPSAGGGDNIVVWYAACVNTSITSGTYSGTVTYTAVTNA